MRTKNGQTEDRGTPVEQLKAVGEHGVQALKDQADAAVTQAQQQASTLTKQAKQEVLGKVDDAKRQVEVQAARQKQAITQQLEQVAELLHTTGQEMQVHYSHYEEQLGDYLESAADQVEHVARQLKRRRRSGVNRAARRLLRPGPALFLIVVLAAAFLVGRALQKSAR